MAEIKWATATGINVYQYAPDGVIYLADQQAQIIDRPLWWQAAGLQETASGYGRRLRSSRVLAFPDGRIRRIYITIYSNAGSAWIILDGFTLHVRDCYDGIAS